MVHYYQIKIFFLLLKNSRTGLGMSYLLTAENAPFYEKSHSRKFFFDEIINLKNARINSYISSTTFTAG